MRACESCGREVDTEWSFCKWCGQPLSRSPEAGQCPACGHPPTPDDKFCRACGSPTEGTLGAVATATTESTPGLDGTLRPTAEPSRIRRLLWPALIGIGTGGVLALLLAQVISAGSGTGDDAETRAVASSLPVVTELAEVQATSMPVPDSTTTTNTVTTNPATTSTVFAASTTAVGVPVTTVPGDLGLSVPMRQPLCDGTYVVFIGASVNPDQYATEISDYLARYPASNYLRTDVSCSSLRPQTESGDAIYAAFFGPFLAFEHACNAADDGPSGSYVKRLDNTTDPNEILECP